MTGPHVAGEVLGGRYEVVDFVGMGGMQFVYLARDTLLGRDVAVKTPQNTSAAKRFKRSAVVSARINHVNVAKTLDFFSAGEVEYLVEEFVEGVDLSRSRLLAPGFVDPYVAAHIFHLVAKGLDASHRVGVIHRDLKPSNVMVSPDLSANVVKITDFGIAKMADEVLTEAAEGGESTITSSGTAVGALPYMSPEAINTPKSVTLATDVWSVGAMMFEILTGLRPFGSGLPAVGAILSGTVAPVPEFVTRNIQLAPLAQSLIDLIRACLVVDPSKRPTASDLVRRCGELCYPVCERHVGKMRLMNHGAWGFIALEGSDVFFHRQSFYGPANPASGSEVIFAKFVGNAWRAHPVLRTRS
jgi:serine/threonine protein kinase